MRDLYEAILGNKNQDYYLEKFEYFDQEGPGLKSSWNWPAFLFGTTWALYRKMYGWFFILWGIIILSNFIEKAGSPGLGGLILIGSWIAFGVFANSLYHSNVKKKIALAQFSIKDESKLLASLDRKGGVHTWIAWAFGLLLIIGIVAAIALPAYHAYMIRKKSAEASEKYDWVEVEPESCPKDYYVKQNKCVKIDWDAAFEEPKKPQEEVNTEFDEFVKNYPATKPQEPITAPTEPEMVQGSTNETSTTSSRNSNKTSNLFGPKEQKCQDQFYAAVNSADQDMPIGEYAEFERKARQRQRTCNNR